MSEIAEDTPTIEEVPSKEDAAKDEAMDTATNDVVEEDKKEEVKKSPSKSPKKESPKKEAQSPKKTSETPKKATPNKKAKKEEAEENGEEEDEEENEKMGILDLPLVLEGKRRRSEVQRMVVEDLPTTKHKAPQAKGSGTPLANIPYVLAKLDERKGIELRPLYRVCFGTMGKKDTIKRELKTFNGFDCSKGDAQYEKHLKQISSFTLADLGTIRRTLGLEHHSKKEDEVRAILDWLMKPEDSGRKAPKKGKKRASTSKGTPKAKRSKKDDTNEEAVESGDSDDDKSDDDESEEDAKSNSPPAKKTPVKKTPKKAAPTPKSKSTIKKTPVKKTPVKKATPKKKKVVEEEEEEADKSAADSDSDTSSQESKKEPEGPSDEVICAKIDELLKTFDLTKVSMKQMILAVCDCFPDTAITNRIAFLKSKIKSRIAKIET